MRRFQACLLAVALLAPSAGRCELVSVFSSDVNEELRRGFTGTWLGGQPRGLAASFESQWIGFTTELDTEADTARLTDATFSYRPVNASKTTDIPGNFPNPPTAITETITFDPVTIETPLTWSESGDLRHREGTVYETHLDFQLSFPDEFRLTGVYSVQGPTQSASVPFSARFLRDGQNWTDTSLFSLRVDVGANFPATATAIGGVGFLYGAHYFATQATSTIFQGTIDGIDVNAQFTPRIWSGVNAGYPAAQLWFTPGSLIPEPSSGLLATTALGAVGALVRRSSRSSAGRRSNEGPLPWG